MTDDDREDFLAAHCPGAIEELTPSLEPTPVKQMTDDEVLAEIRKVLEGKSKLSPRARHLGLHILEKGSVTPGMERRKATRGEHAWQAKSELNQRIPVTSLSRHPQTNEAQYQFDLDQIRRDGRVLREVDIARELTAKQRREVEERYNNACFFCHDNNSKPKPQVEHLVPFLIGGNYGGILWLSLACAPCNRLKGHSCKKCPNWQVKDLEVCKRCFWASPDDYDHQATVPKRVVVESFSDPDEIARFDRARQLQTARDALLVDLGGIEPPTSAMRTPRSPS